MNHKRKNGSRAVTAEKPVDRHFVSSMPQSQSRLLMGYGVKWVSPSGKSNGTHGFVVSIVPGDGKPMRSPRIQFHVLLCEASSFGINFGHHFCGVVTK
jgi:hypothetical protein